MWQEIRAAGAKAVAWFRPRTAEQTADVGVDRADELRAGPGAAAARGSAVIVCPVCNRELPDIAFCTNCGTALREPSIGDDLIGKTVAGRFLVERKISGGGMGFVYLAKQIAVQRYVALKVMHANLVAQDNALDRFKREAKNASRIVHPNVATIFDFGETRGGIAFIAMEYVDGPSLGDLIETNTVLDLSRVAEIVRQIAAGIDRAHRLQIVHRDLKPDNIIIAASPDGADLAKVVDFGIAKVAESDSQNLTAVGHVIGTPAFMSPEQIVGEPLDGRSDIYSLALIAFNAMTGALPFKAENSEAAMRMRLLAAPKLLSDVRPEIPWTETIEAVMKHCLARKPDDRYQTAADFATALSDAIEELLNPGSETVARPVTDAANQPAGHQRISTAEWDEFQRSWRPGEPDREALHEDPSTAPSLFPDLPNHARPDRSLPGPKADSVTGLFKDGSASEADASHVETEPSAAEKNVSTDLPWKLLEQSPTHDRAMDSQRPATPEPDSPRGKERRALVEQAGGAAILAGGLVAIDAGKARAQSTHSDIANSNDNTNSNDTSHGDEQVPERAAPNFLRETAALVWKPLAGVGAAAVAIVALLHGFMKGPSAPAVDSTSVAPSQAGIAVKTNEPSATSTAVPVQTVVSGVTASNAGVAPTLPVPVTSPSGSKAAAANSDGPSTATGQRLQSRTIEVGETASLSDIAKTKWTVVVDTVVAIDNANGTITGLRDGETNVFGTRGKTRVVLPVHVVRASVSRVALSQPATTMLKSESRAMALVVSDRFGHPLSNRSVRWSSSQPDIATVDNGGVVVARSIGSSVITAEVENVSAQCTVVVQERKPLDGPNADAEKAKQLVRDASRDFIAAINRHDRRTVETMLGIDPGEAAQPLINALDPGYQIKVVSATEPALDDQNRVVTLRQTLRITWISAARLPRVRDAFVEFVATYGMPVSPVHLTKLTVVDPPMN